MGDADGGALALEVVEELGAAVEGCAGGAEAGVAESREAVAGDELYVWSVTRGVMMGVGSRLTLQVAKMRDWKTSREI